MVKDIKIHFETIEKANNLFPSGDPYSETTFESITERLNRSWLTKQYFSIGQKALVLPTWIHEQLVPDGSNVNSFATSPGLVNSSGRNYYLLGHPNSIHEPVVDSRGGIIPNPKSYTILFGILMEGSPVYTSETGDVNVSIHENGFPIVNVDWEVDGDRLIYECISGVDDDGNESLAVNVLRGFQTHSLLIAIIPFDQDGITELPQILFDSKAMKISLGKHPEITLSVSPLKSLVLPAKLGSAGKRIIHNIESVEDSCECHAASWAGVFPVRSTPRLLIPLEGEDPEEPDSDDLEYDWEEELQNCPTITTPNSDLNSLFTNSVVVLRSLSDIPINEITVGPSIQETMWLPALAFQTRALDRLGYGIKIVRPVLEHILSRMTEEGLEEIDSQWDGYGSLVLASMNHFRHHMATSWIGEQLNNIKKIIDLLQRLIKVEAKKNPGGATLLPRGNPPLYNPEFWKLGKYYLHNFYVLYCLQISASLSNIAGRKGEVEKLMNDYDSFKNLLSEIIIEHASKYSFLPAGPNQQESALMFFNLFAFYPLRIFNPNFTPLTRTLDRLLDEYMKDGGFLVYHPWNSFGSVMTLQMAQILRFVENFDLIPQILNFMVSNRTNSQGWAEGILNRPNSGTTGDSPNGLVAAEWINLILDLFADDSGDQGVILLKGMPQDWIDGGASCKNLSIRGNGKLSYSVKGTRKSISIEYQYDGELELFVYLPHDISKIEGGSNFQANLYKLDSQNGNAKFLIN